MCVQMVCNTIYSVLLQQHWGTYTQQIFFSHFIYIIIHQSHSIIILILFVLAIIGIIHDKNLLKIVLFFVFIIFPSLMMLCFIVGSIVLCGVYVVFYNK